MAVTEVAKGEPNPGPAGPGVSHGGTRQESLGRGFRESGNEQSPNSREPRDVEGVPVRVQMALGCPVHRQFWFHSIGWTA